MSFFTPYEIAATTTESQIADSMGGRYGEGVYANRAEEYYVKSINDYLMLAKDMNYSLLNQLSSNSQQQIVIKPTQLIDPIDMVKRGRYYIQISYIYAETIDVERVKKVFENVNIALDNMINIYSIFADIMKKGLNAISLNDFLKASEAYNRMKDILIKMLPNSKDLNNVQQGDSYNAPKQNLNGYISTMRDKSIALMGLQLYVFDLAENRSERPFHVPISYGPLHSNPMGYYPLPGVSYFEVFEHDVNFFGAYFDADSSITQYNDYEYLEHDPKNVNSISSSFYASSDYGVERKDVATQVYYTYLVLRLFANMLHNNDLIEIRLDRVKGSGLFTINQEPWAIDPSVTTFSFDKSFTNLCMIYKETWNEAGLYYSEALLYNAQRNLAFIRRQTELAKANAANSQVYNSGYIDIIIFLDTFSTFNEALILLNRTRNYETYLDVITGVFRTVYQNALNQFGPSSGNRGSHTTAEDLKKRIQGIYSYSMSYIMLGGFFEAIQAFDAIIIAPLIDRPETSGTPETIYDHTELRKRGIEGNEFIPAQGSFNMMLSLVAMGIYAMFLDKYPGEFKSGETRESVLQKLSTLFIASAENAQFPPEGSENAINLFSPIALALDETNQALSKLLADNEDVIAFKIAHLVNYINLVAQGYDPNLRSGAPMIEAGGTIDSALLTALGESIVTREQFAQRLDPQLNEETYIKSVPSFIKRLVSTHRGSKQTSGIIKVDFLRQLRELNNIRKLINASAAGIRSIVIKSQISQLSIILCNILFSYSRMIFYDYIETDGPNETNVNALYITVTLGLEPGILRPIIDINIPEARETVNKNKTIINPTLVSTTTPIRTDISFRALAIIDAPFIPLGHQYWATPDLNEIPSEGTPITPITPPASSGVSIDKRPEEDKTALIPPKSNLDLSFPESSSGLGISSSDSDLASQAIISITPSTGPSNTSPTAKYRSIQESTESTPETNLTIPIISESTESTEPTFDPSTNIELMNIVRILAEMGIDLPEYDYMILYELVDYLRAEGVTVDSESLLRITSSPDENMYFFNNPSKANGQENVVFRLFGDFGKASNMGSEMAHMFQMILNKRLGGRSQISTTSVVGKLRNSEEAPGPLNDSDVKDLVEEIKISKPRADTTIKSMADLIEAETAQLAIVVGSAPELAESLKASIDTNKEILILLRGIYLKYYPNLPGGGPPGGDPDPLGGSKGSNDVPKSKSWLDTIIWLTKQFWYLIKRFSNGVLWMYNIITNTMALIVTTASTIAIGLFTYGVVRYSIHETFMNDYNTLTTNSSAILKELETSNSNMSSNLASAKETIENATEIAVGAMNKVYEATVTAGELASNLIETGETVASYAPYIIGGIGILALGFIGYTLYKETSGSNVYVSGVSSKAVKQIHLK